MLFKSLRLQRWEQTAVRALGAGRYELAEYYFKRVYEAAPDRKGAAYNAGLACFAQGKHDAAEGFFLEEFERFGETQHTLKALSELSYQTGRRSDARRYLKRVLRYVEGAEHDLIRRRLEIVEDPDRFEAAVQAQEAVWEGEHALRGNDWETALERFRHAAGLDDTQFAARAGVGKILFDYMNKPGEALEWYREAYALAPDPRYEQQIERIKRRLPS